MGAKRFTISATSVTGCLRGVVFEKQQLSPPPLHPDIERTLAHFRTLALVGQRIQKALAAFWTEKGALVHADDWIPFNPYGFTGRFDALCTIQGKCVLFEIKGASRSFFEWVSAHREARPEHRMQLQVYAQLLREAYPDVEPRMLYVSRYFFEHERTLKGVEVPIVHDGALFGEAVERAQAVASALQGGSLPEPLPAIGQKFPEGAPDIPLGAITCRHHVRCLGDEHWYERACAELGKPMTARRTEVELDTLHPPPEEAPF